jgi:hypothetical protein
MFVPERPNQISPDCGEIQATGISTRPVPYLSVTG